MNNKIKKIIILLSIVALLCGCSIIESEPDVHVVDAIESAPDAILQDKIDNSSSTERSPQNNKNRLLFTSGIGNLDYWVYNCIYTSFYNSAKKDGYEVSQVVFSEVNNTSMDLMYADYCEPLYEELQKGDVAGIASLLIPIGAFPYFENYTEDFPTMIYRGNPFEGYNKDYPQTADSLCRPIEKNELSKMASEYIINNYADMPVVGSVISGTSEAFDYLQPAYDMLAGKAKLVDFQVVGFGLSAEERNPIIKQYCLDKNIDIILTDSIQPAQTILDIDADVIYIGANEKAIEYVKTGDIKAVICTDPYAVGEIAYENLMKIINGEDFEEEICIEPILIDTAEEAEDFLKRNSQN